MKTEDLARWTEIVVAVGGENWVDSLVEMYKKVDKACLPHYRFAGEKGLYGFSLRMYSPSEKTICDLVAVAKSRNLQYSLNPKTRSGDPLRALSGWFENLSKGGPSYQSSSLLHLMSELAIDAFTRGFTQSQDRAQIAHQFGNMMAVVEVLEYRSRFSI